MKKARTWTEEVVFVACPECEETIELGVDVVISEGEELECEHCQKPFLITEKPR